MNQQLSPMAYVNAHHHIEIVERRLDRLTRLEQITVQTIKAAWRANQLTEVHRDILRRYYRICA